jgi:hypothetical protein
MGLFLMGKKPNTIFNLLEQIDCEVGLLSCWPWLGGKHEDGYGVIRYKGKKHKAHRLFYKYFINDLPPDVVVRHICDNPSCCNPMHLLPGSQADNIADMMARNRKVQGVSPFKMTKQQSLKMHELRKQNYSYSKIAAIVGCSIASVHRYLTGKIKTLN